jgi:hypothetical protein
MLFSEELGKQKRKLSVTVVFSRDIAFLLLKPLIDWKGVL